MVSIFQRFSLAWFLMAGAALVMPHQARAVDECGASAAGVSATSPYPEYNAANHASYVVGFRARVGNDVYEATAPITGAPDSTVEQNGWTIALVAGAATGYRTNGVLCDSADTTGYDPTIVYGDDDLAIFYRRSDAQTITHTGENAEIHILSGSVIKPDDGNTDPAVGNDEGATIASYAISDAGSPSKRIFVGQGATVANNDVTVLRREERTACTYDQLSRMECGTRTPGSPPLRVSATAYIVDVVVPGHAIDMSVLGMGTLTAIIQGSVSAAAGRGINLRSDDGDITLNIAGSVRARGERAHAVLATATGAGNVDVDVSGTITTSGDDSYALYATSRSSDLQRSLDTTGDVDVDIAGGTITTTGSDSIGVRAYADGGTGDVTLDITGNTRIATSGGGDSDAISAVAWSSILIVPSVSPPGTVSVSGDVTVTIAGAASITTASRGSRGIHAEARGGNVSVNITGAATISAPGGHGIQAVDRTWSFDSTDERSVTVMLGADAGARVASGGVSQAEVDRAARVGTFLDISRFEVAQAILAGGPTATDIAALTEISRRAAAAERPPSTSAINVHGNTGLSQLSVTVGSGNFVCAGSFSGNTNACLPSSTARGVSFSRASGLSYTGTPTYAAVLTNAGTIIGDIESVGSGSTAVLAASDSFRTDIINSGVLRGSLYLGAGDDRVVNSGTLTLTGDADFGGGDGDTLTSTSTGTLVIDHAANGRRQISLIGLETLTVMAGAPSTGSLRSGVQSNADSPAAVRQQSPVNAQTGTGGVIRFVVDFSQGSPGEPLLNVGDAMLTIAPLVEVELVGTDGVLPITGGDFQLFTGMNVGNIDPATLTPGRGLESLTIDPTTGNLQVRIPRQVTDEQLRLGLQTYDTLLQSTWFADRALARIMESTECEAADKSGKRRAAKTKQDQCGWMRVMSRFTRHDPSQGVGFTEDAFGLAAGYQIAQPRWSARAAIAYDGGDVTQKGGPGQPGFTSEAQRFLLGLIVGTGTSAKLPKGLDMDGTIRFSYVSYEAQRVLRLLSGALVTRTGEPDLLQVTALLGMESRGRVKGRAEYGKWDVAARVEAGALYQSADSFTEGGGAASAFTTEDFQRVLGVGSASFRARGLHDSRWGKMSTWLNGGLNVFIGEVASDLKANIGGIPVRASGTMDQILFDVGAGFGYQPSKNMELSLGYQGSVSAGNDTDIHHVNIRMNYLF